MTRPDAAVRAAAKAKITRLLQWTVILAGLAAGGALFYLWHGGARYLHMVMATAAGVFCTILLTGGLMAALFFSSSRHDEEARGAFRTDQP